MIRIENLTKSFRVRGRREVIIDNLSFTLPANKSLALLGRNGAGKSTLLRILSGSMRPDSGKIYSDGSISWPIGLSSSFHNEMTGVQNVRFVARVYGVDSDSLIEFVKDFAEIGRHFYMPLRSYSSGMRSRILFGTAMGIKFDTYLIDEVTAVGDASFKAKSRTLFRERVKSASAVMVSHNMREIREFCDSAILLDHGKLTYFEDVEDAIAAHQDMVSD